MPSDSEYLLSVNRSQYFSETDTFTEDRYRQMYHQLSAKTVDILDVGCNTGRGGAVLCQENQALKITGLDCLAERIEKLDGTVYHDKISGFSTDIQRPDKSFDAIVGGEFIEHVPPVQIDPTLCEFFRILRLRGRLILTTPNPHYLRNRWKGLSVLLDDSHVTQHYPESLRHRMLQIGFSNVKIVGSGRLTSILGAHFPLLSAYGSYLIRGDKW